MTRLYTIKLTRRVLGYSALMLVVSMGTFFMVFYSVGATWKTYVSPAYVVLPPMAGLMLLGGWMGLGDRPGVRAGGGILAAAAALAVVVTLSLYALGYIDQDCHYTGLFRAIHCHGADLPTQ